MSGPASFQSNFTFINELPPAPTHPRLNGLVNIMGPNTNDRFSLYEQTTKGATDYKEALTGNWIATPLSNTFFSKENIQILQNGIRAGVFKATNQYIGSQDEDELKTIMRSIFLQYSANMPDHIKEQIIALNNKVLAYCVPNIVGELDGYIKYRRDISTLAMPMQMPAMVSNKGNKVLELKPWF
jgi:hypothetical protein